MNHIRTRSVRGRGAYHPHLVVWERDAAESLLQWKKLHKRFVVELELVHVQLDELLANVKDGGQDICSGWQAMRKQAGVSGRLRRFSAFGDSKIAGAMMSTKFDPAIMNEGSNKIIVMTRHYLTNRIVRAKIKTKNLFNFEQIFCSQRERRASPLSASKFGETDFQTIFGLERLSKRANWRDFCLLKGFFLPVGVLLLRVV